MRGARACSALEIEGAALDAVISPSRRDRGARARRNDAAEEVELTGLGGSRRHWLMRSAPLADGTSLIRFVDRSEARAAEQMRVDFVANASHELRTPLATLIGYTETLREQADEIDPATRERFLVGRPRRGAANAARGRGPDLAVADRGREVHRADRGRRRSRR